VSAGRADGPFVKVHGVERTAFNPGDLCADQRGAVLEILRAILRPYFELSVVGNQCFKLPVPLADRCGIEMSGVCEPGVVMVIRVCERGWGGPEEGLCLDCGGDGAVVLTGEVAGLQLAYPVDAGRIRQTRVLLQVLLENVFVERPIVKRAELDGQVAKRIN